MEVRAMKRSIVCLVTAVILLLVADALAFHDLLEPHTVRDWLMLAGSGLVVIGLIAGSLSPRWMTTGFG
jgi:hypothetical protein